MSSDEIVVRISDLSKCFHIYQAPQDRLKEFVLPPLRSALGLPERHFFREFWALRDVEFEVKKGESVGILGRNGSGKSTLLQIICGTLTPTTGLAETKGRIAALLELGSGFSPDFTGRENVFLNGAVLGLSAEEINNRFDEIAGFADIGEFIDQPVKTYSSGMLVRLAFAVQVCVEPEILIVDEALAVGDSLFQKRCFERMERLTSNGTTLLFVSHDQESIRTLTHRAVLLRNGVVQTIGTSAETLLAYRKQLHEDETKALNEAAKQLKARADANRQLHVAPVTSDLEQISEQPQRRTDAMSFGDMEAEVLRVHVSNAKGEPCAYFDPRDSIKIEVECKANVQIANLNVALRIRNREGVKMYSWGTLNQDMAINSDLLEGDVFWNRIFQPGELFTVQFTFGCGLGRNLYEVQAAISHEGKPYYAEQRMLHWMDEAAFFTVVTNPNEYHFGGVSDLRMSCCSVQAREV